MFENLDTRDHYLTPDECRPEYARGDYTEVLNDEGRWMSNGFIVKVRFIDRPLGTQVSWHWFPLGNCWLCRDFSETPKNCGKGHDGEDFTRRWVRCDCPDYHVGSVNPSDDPDEKAVAQAADLLSGDPPEPTQVLQILPWTPWRAFQAHQQEFYLAKVRLQCGAFARIHPGETPSWDMPLDNDDYGNIEP